MSRTDIHRPIWVKMSDPTLRHEWMELHDHTGGRDCDIALELQRGYHSTHCHMAYVGHVNTYCGCRLCTGHWDRKAARRKERAQGRRDCRKHIAAHRGQDPDLG